MLWQSMTRLFDVVLILFEFLICSVNFYRVSLHISLDVEIVEKSKEHYSMKENHIAVGCRKITLNEQWETCVDGEGCKLNQLHCCQVPQEKFWFDACKDSRSFVTSSTKDIFELWDRSCWWSSRNTWTHEHPCSRILRMMCVHHQPI